MANLMHRNQRGWRCASGWLAAYGLFLNLFFAGISMGGAAAAAPVSGDSIGLFALCINQGTDGKSPIGKPVHTTHFQCMHCAQCANGEHPALIPLMLSVSPFFSSSLPFSDLSERRSSGNASIHSRAPPA